MRPFGVNMHQAGSRGVSGHCLTVVAALMLGCALKSAAADIEVSVMTLDGVVQQIEQPNPPPDLKRLGVAEDGGRIVVDEFAVLDVGTSKAAFTSQGFAGNHLSSITMALRPVGERNVRQESQGVSAQVLVIQHQRGHALNANFAETPMAEFVPQAISTNELEGQRGFAVIAMGASGQVREVKTLTGQGRVSNAKLRRALASGIKTSFPDERRHDHTVYLAYEVRDQTLSQAGMPIVTLPMCVCP
jgi:hypothetical protein